MSYGLQVINTAGQSIINPTRKSYVLKGVSTPTSVDMFMAGTNAPSSFTVNTGLPYSGKELVFAYAIDQSPVVVLTTFNNSSPGVSCTNLSGANTSTLTVIQDYQFRYKNPWSSVIGKQVSLYGGTPVNVVSVVENRATYYQNRLIVNFSNNISAGTNYSELISCSSLSGTLCVCIGVNGTNNNPSNYRVLVFDEIDSVVSGGYGLISWDSYGNPLFDTRQKMLSIAAIGVTPPNIPGTTRAGTTSAGNNATFQANYSVAPQFGVIPSNAAFSNQPIGYVVDKTNTVYGSNVYAYVAYNGLPSGNFVPYRTGTANLAQPIGDPADKFWGFNNASTILAIDATQYI